MTGRGFTSITPPVIHVYLLITLLALKFLCSRMTFLLISPNLLHLKRILSAKSSSPFSSSISIISLKRLLTSGKIFDDSNKLSCIELGEAIVLTTERWILFEEVIDKIFLLIILFCFSDLKN